VGLFVVSGGRACFFGWAMNWIVLSQLSAVFLGLYEIAKKESLRGNAVPVVLLFNVLTSASVYLPVILVSRLSPGLLPSDLLRVDDLSWTGHLMLAGKSLLAGSSWVFASFAEAFAGIDSGSDSSQQSVCHDSGGGPRTG
jgi:hypothetical protein